MLKGGLKTGLRTGIAALWKLAAGYCTTDAAFPRGVLMHLATYNLRGRQSFGVVVGDGVVDLRPRLAPKYTSLVDVLRAGALAEIEAKIAGVRADFPVSE